MPLAREAPKRKASEVSIPEKGEDPAERKRILNVLAQRRYRQRRKEHVKSLEAEAGRTREESTTSRATEASKQQSPTEDAPQASPEFITAGLDTFTAPDSYFRPLDDTQARLFDDPFAMYDPNFVAFPTDLHTDWNQISPSSDSPFSTTDPSNLSLTSFNSPSTASRTPSDYQWTFPDDAHLEVLELKLLHGAMTIAKSLNLQDLIWSLTSTSPFADPATAMAHFNTSPFRDPSRLAQYDHLPVNLRPTVAQLSLPHHPMLDILPWPTVRDKLILMLNQPPEVRPKAAQSPMALLEFVYDIEDTAEGVRIWGEDPFSDQGWEVGEKVFSNWWWAFDTEVIRRSNELRKRRGAKLLGIPQGSVLGEV